MLLTHCLLYAFVCLGYNWGLIIASFANAGDGGGGGGGVTYVLPRKPLLVVSYLCGEIHAV